MLTHTETPRQYRGPEGVTIYHRAVDVLGGFALATVQLLKTGVPEALNPQTSLLNPHNWKE